MSSSLRDRLARALLDNGLDAWGRSTIHRHYCGYAPCGCFAGLLDDLVADEKDPA